MKFNLKHNKPELTFLAIGILMLIIVIGYSAIAIRFLLRNLNSAFSQKLENVPAVIHFQIEKAEILKR